MKALVLDSEAISQLARAKDGAARGTVHEWVRAAERMGAEIVVPAAVLAEQYRGSGHDQALDACLARYPGIRVVDTTRSLARRIGNLLASVKAGSEHHVDAAVVAVALAQGGGVILTSDPGDLSRLADASPVVTVVAL